MRILTVRQPWAWAIIHGGKNVENRVRNIAGDYRGPVAIHAAQANDVEAWAKLGRLSLFSYGLALDARESLIGGAIIGVVDLVDVHRPLWDNSCDGERVCSPWAEVDGWPHHLVLATPRALAEPITYRGALGLRRLDDAATARILTQLGEPACPECRDGKHRNCTGWALDADDKMVPCHCDHGGRS
jgi:hypothetical protein